MPTLPRLSSLQRKLLRDLWHIRGQALAIAVVIGCGIGMYVMSKATLASLEQARSSYYQQQHLAQIIAPVVRAPKSVAAMLQQVPGVSRVQSRITRSALVEVPGFSTPITSALISLPPDSGIAISDLILRSGRQPDPRHPEEVLVLKTFADAHGLQPGALLFATINGSRRQLTVAGTVLSPEHIYTIPPGDIVPDNKRFGVLWMRRTLLADAFSFRGAANSFVATLGRQARQAEVILAFDRILEPYGPTGAFGRDQQVSDQFLSNEIDQLRTMSWVLPPIFLLVSSFLLHIVLSRLIATERENIGLLKAFGYTNRAIATHYLGLVVIIAVWGAAIGLVLGISLSRGMNTLYLEYFHFPSLPFVLPPAVPLTAFLVSIVVAVVATLGSVRDSARLQPAVAMVPPAPPDYSRHLRSLEQWGRKLSQPARMVLRHLLRWPGRAAMTIVGIALSMALLIGSSFSLDAIRHMIDVSFNLVDRQDLRISFVEKRPRAILHEISRLPGVLLTEGYSVVPVTLRNGPIKRNEVLLGYDTQPELARVIDQHYQPVTIPEDGLLLTRSLAERLQAGRGDILEVQVREGRRGVYQVPISGIVESYLGTGAYMNRHALDRLTGETAQISGANLRIDADQKEALYSTLQATPVVAGIALLNDAQKAFDQTLKESMGTMVFFNTLFAGLIVVGVVYNSARVALSERGRELASLRVLGLTRREVSFILLAELWILTLLSLPLGALLGWLLAWGLTLSLDTELFRIPLIIENRTYVYGAVVICIATWGSGRLIRRRVRQLDLVAVLKTRE